MKALKGWSVIILPEGIQRGLRWSKRQKTCSWISFLARLSEAGDSFKQIAAHFPILSAQDQCQPSPEIRNWRFFTMKTWPDCAWNYCRCPHKSLFWQPSHNAPLEMSFTRRPASESAWRCQNYPNPTKRVFKQNVFRKFWTTLAIRIGWTLWTEKFAGTFINIHLQYFERSTLLQS